MTGMDQGQYSSENEHGQIIVVDSKDIEISDLSFSKSSIPIQVAYCEDIVFENISISKKMKLNRQNTIGHL